jgi:gluconolactonase
MRAESLAYDVKHGQHRRQWTSLFRRDVLEEGPLLRTRWLEDHKDGNLSSAPVRGISVFSPDGTHLGSIETGGPVSNLAWGDDGSMRFITGRSTVYRLQLKTKGSGF